MPRPTCILMILTLCATMGPGGEPTGLWLEELATPYRVFAEAGCAVTLASIDGGAAPVDPRSLGPAEERVESVARFLADPHAAAALAATIPLDQVRAGEHEAVFLPGGHGTMWDLPESEALAALLRVTWAEDRVIAALCHGPAGLVRVTDGEGAPLVRGRRITGFSNSEEQAVGLAERVPFRLETRLRELGGLYESGPDFQPFARADARLVTGQNPASSALTARLTLAALEAAR